MKLLGNTENKITKDTNGENIPQLEINNKNTSSSEFS